MNLGVNYVTMSSFTNFKICLGHVRKSCFLFTTLAFFAFRVSVLSAITEKWPSLEDLVKVKSRKRQQKYHKQMEASKNDLV